MHCLHVTKYVNIFHYCALFTCNKICIHSHSYALFTCNKICLHFSLLCNVYLIIYVYIYFITIHCFFFNNLCIHIHYYALFTLKCYTYTYFIAMHCLLIKHILLRVVTLRVVCYFQYFLISHV